MSRISPLVLLVMVILAIGFFILGLLQLVIRCVLRSHSSSSAPHSNRLPNAVTEASYTFQSQLQQLFRLHDSGLDQPSIDALPVFYYKDVMGSKEPFDCAVCLSEFSFLDKLKFLPNCSHAFHIHCIETWLLCNSTCPLCRSRIGLWNHVENPLFSYDTCSSLRLQESAAPAPTRTLSIRLGKFRSTNEGTDGETKMENEVPSSSIDGRRCYSMGAFQYFVSDGNLQVALPSGSGISKKANRQFAEEEATDSAEAEGNEIGTRGRGDSFSMSKIWLWSKKDKFLSSLEANDNVIVSMPNDSDLV